MTDSNRRDFLAMGGAAIAASALAGVASAQPGGAASRPRNLADRLKQLVPGAVDDSGEWTLPPLQYDYNALEPVIDEQTMRLHHDKHHAGYVRGLKAAEAKLAEAREAGDFGMTEYWVKKASFHGGGHFLHCIFWECMGPNAGGEPTGGIADAIKETFGSYDSFTKQFTAASRSVEGSGWGILGYQLASGGLTILQGQNQNYLSQWAFVPLLAVDVWEHAYYLKYQNNRGEYLKNWWSVVDWAKVGARYDLLTATRGGGGRRNTDA